MILHSTAGKATKVSFAEGIACGLAPDGGLYMPDTLPHLPKAFYKNIAGMSVREVGYVVMSTLLGDLVNSEQLKVVVDEALSFEMPLRKLSDRISQLELFHGPTMGFNDIGAGFMARLLPLLDPIHGRRRDIILATSGDSGGAVARSFERVASTRVIVVFPRGKLSPEQISQFAGLRHVLAIEVDGNFDVCQNLVKQILLESLNSQTDHIKTSGNSINLLRQIPAIISYFYGYATMKEQYPDDEIVIAIPCGNLGNMTAALIAKRMGLPVKRFVAANNANDAFVEYLKTGGIRQRRTLMTLASAMDVGNPSNLARIIDLYGGNLASLRNDVSGVSIADDEIILAMRTVFDKLGIVLDPQTAAAYSAAVSETLPEEKVMIIASTHPSKFREAVKQAIGLEQQKQFPHWRPIHGHHSSHTYHTGNTVIKIPPTITALRRVIDNH